MELDKLTLERHGKNAMRLMSISESVILREVRAEKYRSGYLLKRSGGSKRKTGTFAFATSKEEAEEKMHRHLMGETEEYMKEHQRYKLEDKIRL